MSSKYHAWKSPVHKADPAPFVSMIDHQPDDRPVLKIPGASASNWVTCPPKPLYTARPNVSMTFTDKAASFSPGHDADHGYGANRRKGPFDKEPTGYTARTPSSTGKTVKGISARAQAQYAGGRTWAR